MESQDFEDREAIPRAENLLLSLEELLAAGLHIGTRIKTVDMEKYIFRVRPDGLFILNIGETNEKIRVAAKFMARFEPGRVLAVSSRLYGKTPIDRFAELTKAMPIVGRFMPGLISNPLQPKHAGPFYPDTEGALRTQSQQSFLPPLGPRAIPTIPGTRNQNLRGLIVPHAGYRYSGPVAAHSYYHLASAGIFESIIILGPNHTGLGSGVSTVTDGEWSTPLGEVPIDTEVAREIVDSSDLVDVEYDAHRNEHSIEVQLPFLQFICPGRFKFVPICMMLQDLRTSIEVGEAVAKVAEKRGATVIASSDWTHYEPQEEARSKDKQAIEAALQMNETKFQEIIEERSVSACGYGPVTAMIHAAKLRGARNGNLLSYQTSGDVVGDKSSVVGYAAASFEK